MQIILLKKYKPHTRELKIGTEMGVINEVGLDLIERGIARDVTIRYESDLQKKRDEDTSEIEEIIKASKEDEEDAAIKKAAKIIKKKKNN